MADFFETRVANLEPKEDKKKSSADTKKSKEKKSLKKCKRADSNSSVVKSSKDSFVKKFCVVYGKCSQSTDNCKDLRNMVNKYKQKKRETLSPTERTTRN